MLGVALHSSGLDRKPLLLSSKEVAGERRRRAQPAKVEVAGSKPVSRSNPLPSLRREFRVVRANPRTGSW
jgi:hypothetical protein